MARVAGVQLLIAVLSLYGHSQSTSLQSQAAGADGQRSSQEQKQQVYEPATVLKVTTRLVVVEVVATDKHGQVVTDLKPQDFTLLEDGKPQEVRIFNFRRPPDPGTASTALKPLSLPPNVFTNIPAYNRNNSLNIIVLDLLNTDFNDQAYGRQQILKYLASIPEGEPITVAVYTLGLKLRLVQDFTSDFVAVKKTVESLKSERTPVFETLNALPAPADKEFQDEPHKALRDFSRTYEGAEQLDRRVEYTLDGLFALSRRLSGYPGRKNLIWISTTFPIGFGPNENLRANEFDNLRDYEQAIVSASQALVDAEIAVYPIDPRGPLSSSQYGGKATLPENQAISLRTESEAGIAEQNTMKQIADLTGGKAYYNQNDLNNAIRNSIADGSTYYTLAYYPADKNWNGEFRKISLRVDRLGVRLRHRPGYYALQLKLSQNPKQMYTAFGRALNLDSPVSTALRFEAGVVQPSQKTGNKVLLNFALDPHAVSFETGDDGLHRAAVDCAVQAYTEKGHLIKTDASTLSLALDDQGFSKAMQTYLLGRATVDLTPGFYLLRLGVMDEHTGIIGTTSARVTINAPK